MTSDIDIIGSVRLIMIGWNQMLSKVLVLASKNLSKILREDKLNNLLLEI